MARKIIHGVYLFEGVLFFQQKDRLGAVAV